MHWQSWTGEPGAGGAAGAGGTGRGTGKHWNGEPGTGRYWGAARQEGALKELGVGFWMETAGLLCGGHWRSQRRS